MPNQVSEYDLPNVDLGIQYSRICSYRHNCLARGSPAGVIAGGSSFAAGCHSSSEKITSIVLAESLYYFSDTTPGDSAENEK